MVIERLSPAMCKTLQVIKEHGGEAHPERGGYWRSKPSPDGEQLRYGFDGWEGDPVPWPVTTQTIKSLVARGMLEVIDGAGFTYLPAYRLTDSALKMTAQSECQSNSPME